MEKENEMPVKKAQTNDTAEDRGTRNNADLWRGGAKRLVIIGLLLGILLFAGAGTTDWFRGWLFIALLVVTFSVNLVVMIIKNPVLLRERWKRRKDTKDFDKVFGVIYLVSVLVMLVLAGADAVRYQWSSMAASLVYPGAALHFAGIIPVQWSLVANPHLETTVRIQTDRGHKVISRGPYRYVRHPMYVGVILMFFGWPLILGSWVALGISCFIVCLLCVRTHFEDRTLRSELPGYTEFCRKTRYRLVPGLW